MPSVTTQVRYSKDRGRNCDFYYYEPPEDTRRYPAGTDKRMIQIHDGWDQAEGLSVDVEGFEIRSFDPSFTDFDSDASIEGTFYDQVIDFVTARTGARRVKVFDHTIRRRMSDDLKQQTVIRRPAVQLIHSDYTEASGPQRVHDLLPDEAEDLLSRRVAFYNVWKPLFDPVEELPLACCDCRSMASGDLMIMELKYPDRTGEVYVMRYSPEHRWSYFPLMQPDQALLLKTYDSETDGRARFNGHTAFEDPTTPENARPRQSIEVRTMAFF